MQKPTLFAYVNQEFSTIPIFDGLIVDGFDSAEQGKLHLFDGRSESPSSGMFYFQRGQWYFKCLSNFLVVNGILYQSGSGVLLDDLTIIHFCDNKGNTLRSKFIIFQKQANEWTVTDRDSFSANMAQLETVDCAILANYLVIALPQQIIYQDLGHPITSDSEREIKQQNKSLLSINLQDVSVGTLFSRKSILKDIQVAFQSGEMILILGGSGAGKTTFMEAVTGLVKADINVYYNQIDLLNSDYRNQIITLAPQLPDQHYRMEDTVIKNLDDAAKLFGPSEFRMNEQLRKSVVEEVLRKLDLEAVQKSLCSSLSGGQKKKLTIAMEYVTQPEVFFMDEPDSGVDGSMVIDIMNNIRDISNEGKIVCVITHTPDRIRNLFDKVMVIGKGSKGYGQLCYFGPVDETLKYFDTDSLENVVHKVSGIDNTTYVDILVEKFKSERIADYV